MAIARKHGRTPAQTVLRWHIQLGNVVIPKSVTPSRIKENIDVFGFELDPEDMAAISALNEDRPPGPRPGLVRRGVGPGVIPTARSRRPPEGGAGEPDAFHVPGVDGSA
ncbi:hypothetical protein SALBM135S_05916 [Streptomyces alboniger]